MGAYTNKLNLGPSIYYDDKFMNVIEDHLDYLKTKETTRLLPVEEIDVIRYQCDFYGLLMKFGIPVHMHWVVLRCSGLISPSKVPNDLKNVVLPTEAELTKLRQTLDAVANIRT